MWWTTWCGGPSRKSLSGGVTRPHLRTVHQNQPLSASDSAGELCFETRRRRDRREKRDAENLDRVFAPWWSCLILLVDVDDQFKAVTHEVLGQEGLDGGDSAKAAFPGFGIEQAGNGVEFAQLECENQPSARIFNLSSLCVVGGVNVTGSASCRDHGSESPAFLRKAPTHQTWDLHGFFQTWDLHGFFFRQVDECHANPRRFPKKILTSFKSRSATRNNPSRMRQTHPLLSESKIWIAFIVW